MKFVFSGISDDHRIARVMQLHFSWTVLATIIWTILLDSSAKGTVSKKRKLLGLEENSIGVVGPIDTSWKLENTIKTIQYVGPNVETKSPSDITKRRIVTGNDMAGKVVGNAVENHHVREQSLSQETPISNKYGRNNGNLETREYRGKDNDGVSIFHHRSKASLKQNIPMMHYADGGMSSLNKHQLNVPRKLTTERVKPDGGSTKASLYDQKEEAVNTIKTSATSVSLVNGSNTSSVNYQSLKSSSQTHISEYDNFTHLTLSKWNSSMEKTGFVRYSSFNDNSSAKDQTLHKAFSEAQTSSEHQGVSSPEIQDPLPFLRTNSTIENIGKRKEDEKVFPREVRYLLDKRSLVWGKQRDRNVLEPTRGNILINGPLESDKILEYEAKEKTESSRSQQDPNISKQLSDPETADEKDIQKMTKRQLDIQRNSEDFAVSTFSQIPAILLDQEVNRVPESSSLNDVTSGLTMSGKVSPEPSKELAGQIGGSSSHVGQTKTDSSTETTNDQGCKHITKLSFGWRSLPKDFTDSRHLDKTGPSYPEKGDSHSRQKFREGLEIINYLQDGKVKQRSLYVSSLNNKASYTKRDKAGIIGADKNIRKGFEKLDMNGTKNNAAIGSSMSRVGDNNKISRWNQKSDDNPSSQDIKLKVHGKVVKTKLTSSLRDRRAHKTFIGRNSVGDTNLGSYQTPQEKVQLQESKKYRQKLTFDTTPIELNGIPGWQDVTSAVQRTLANSETSSLLWPEVERENTLSDSNVRANAAATRKMELSGEDTQGSRNIRIPKKDSARKKNFLSGEPSKVEPRSMQFLQASSTESNTSGDDAVFNQENRENSIQEIFQPVRPDTSPLMGLPRAQIYSRSSASDRNDQPVYESDRKVPGSFESVESKAAPDRKKFYPTTENDGRAKITSSSFDKSDGEVVSLDSRGDRIQWTDAGPVTSAVGKSNALTTLRKMARAQFADSIHNKTTQSRNHSRATEIVNKQENYIRQVQTNEINEISIMNRSRLRDQIESNEDDSLEKLTKERNHRTNQIHKVVDCDTCKATDDVDTNENGRSRTFHFARYEKRSKKKVARSVTETSVPNSLLPLDLTRGNGVSLDPTITDSHGNSLGATSTKLEATAHPKEQAEERLRWKNFGTLVRHQQQILDEPTLNDFDLSRDPTSTPQAPAVNVEKFRDADERNGSLKRVFRRSNGSSSLPSDKARHYEDDSSSRKPVKKYEKFEMRPSRSNEALPNESKKEFSDNSDDVSRDQRNSRPSSTFSEENVSGNVNSVKISVHDDTATTAAMNSMKIDSSISLIDQTSHRVDIAGNKKYIGNVATHILLEGNGKAIGKTYDGNVKGKQMKSGFTKDNTDSVATTETMMNDSPDYKTTEKREINNAQSSAVDDDVGKPAKVTNKILLIPVADLTLSNFPSSQTFGPTYSSLTSYSSNSNDSTITNSSQTLEAVLDKQQKSQSHQARLRPSDNMEESIDARILNQTVYDNSTRVTNTLNQWPVKHSAVVEGDLVLGGLMMVHEREDSVTCGPVMPQGGVQALEAMLYTLDWLNKRDLVPGVKIGAHILDDCDKDTYGLEMAVDFIKGQ